MASPPRSVGRQRLRVCFYFDSWYTNFKANYNVILQRFYLVSLKNILLKKSHINNLEFSRWLISRKKIIRNVILVALQVFLNDKMAGVTFSIYQKSWRHRFVLSCFQYHQMPAKMNLKTQKNFHGCGNFWQKVETFCQNHLITLLFLKIEIHAQPRAFEIFALSFNLYLWFLTLRIYKKLTVIQKILNMAMSSRFVCDFNDFKKNYYDFKGFLLLLM